MLLFGNCVIIRHWTFRHLENKICQTSRFLSPSLPPLRAHPFRSERDVWERGRSWDEYDDLWLCVGWMTQRVSSCLAIRHNISANERAKHLCSTWSVFWLTRAQCTLASSTSRSQCISTFLPYTNQLSNQNNEQRLKHGNCPSGSGHGGTGSNINNGDVLKQCQPVKAHSTGYYLLKYRSLLVYHFSWCGHWVATRTLGILNIGLRRTCLCQPAASLYCVLSRN